MKQVEIHHENTYKMVGLDNCNYSCNYNFENLNNLNNINSINRNRNMNFNTSMRTNSINMVQTKMKDTWNDNYSCNDNDNNNSDKNTNNTINNNINNFDNRIKKEKDNGDVDGLDTISITHFTDLTGLTSDDGNEHDTIDCDEFADEFKSKFNDENINVESDDECDNYIHVFDENTRFGTPFAGYTITDDYANVSIDYSFNHANSNSNENDTGCNYDNDIANVMDGTRQIEVECNTCDTKFGNLTPETIFDTILNKFGVTTLAFGTVLLFCYFVILLFVICVFILSQFFFFFLFACFVFCCVSEKHIL